MDDKNNAERATMILIICLLSVFELVDVHLSEGNHKLLWWLFNFPIRSCIRTDMGWGMSIGLLASLFSPQPPHDRECFCRSARLTANA
jgi:hypothetical protein